MIFAVVEKIYFWLEFDPKIFLNKNISKSF